MDTEWIDRAIAFAAIVGIAVTLTAAAVATPYLIFVKGPAIRLWIETRLAKFFPKNGRLQLVAAVYPYISLSEDHWEMHELDGWRLKVAHHIRFDYGVLFVADERVDTPDYVREYLRTKHYKLNRDIANRAHLAAAAKIKGQ